MLLGERVEPLLLVLVSIGKQDGGKEGEAMGTAVFLLERVLLANRLPLNTLTLISQISFPASSRAKSKMHKK